MNDKLPFESLGDAQDHLSNPQTSFLQINEKIQNEEGHHVDVLGNLQVEGDLHNGEVPDAWDLHDGVARVNIDGCDHLFQLSLLHNILSTGEMKRFNL